MKIYIASPFFNKEQLGFVSLIETRLNQKHIPYFSPRESGIIKNMTQEKKQLTINNIYDLNIQMIQECNIMLAVIDNFDPGTVFEIGFAAALNKKIITITNHNYGLNVMLSKCIYAHTMNIDNAISAILEEEFQTVNLKVTT